MTSPRWSSSSTTGPYAPGEWLQIHSGFALARLTEEERREADRIWNTTQEER